MKGILFVDDDQNMLQGLRRIVYPLRGEWEASLAASGEEALALLSRNPFDVIVTEIRMPVMDGVELLSKVRDRHPELIRIVLSGQTERNLTLKSTSTAHQYVAKPADTQSLRMTIARAAALKDSFEKPSLQAIISGTRVLPSIPSLYMELIDRLENSESSVEDVAGIISKDTAMTAKVLQLANSAFFGLQRRIASPKDAVIYLGIDTIKALALTVQVFSQYRGTTKDFSVDDLVQHNLGTGTLARRIAKRVGAPRLIMEDAFLAGLLHDIGALILATACSAQYEEAMRMSREKNKPLWVAEQEIFGTSHADVGAYLLWLWGIPDSVIEAVAYHHEPHRCPATEFGPLAAVHIGNAIDRLHPEEANCPDGLDLEYLERVQLPKPLSDWCGWREEAIRLREAV